jgi:hypothetical protein
MQCNERRQNTMLLPDMMMVTKEYNGIMEIIQD